ncbi:hypothetical protein [Desulfoluna spongiiphila]|uniref:Lipopolysaccharide assembly protein A domain-containing protein n=1 Tax=Desulfoluna spongiiphila TaxID=419481 RepID=A0A1G5JH08_9BACT|nr:hypothetical protein [Desulfoluna spongiiphila]SCY87663.1 hypothetical protein SAMN05216233_1315 [Desulfoluna spongiiphila]VVS94924.1 consensus disorder prediction [Desulfoluna spongiiphila]
MKKLKFALMFLILVALFVVAYQNRVFFLNKEALSVDLKLWAYQSPAIAHGLYFLGFFLFGFLLAYTTGLMARFRSSKMVKELNAVIDSQQEKISTLRGEMDLLKRRPVEAPEPQAEIAAEEPSEAPALDSESQQS